MIDHAIQPPPAIQPPSAIKLFKVCDLREFNLGIFLLWETIMQLRANGKLNNHLLIFQTYLITFREYHYFREFCQMRNSLELEHFVSLPIFIISTNCFSILNYRLWLVKVIFSSILIVRIFKFVMMNLKFKKVQPKISLP